MQPDWSALTSAYGRPYDPRPAIEALKSEPTEARAWAELWEELHHQGDLGEASYAAVPLLVGACANIARDWNFYLLVATIELERARPSNPALPDWLAQDYPDAIQIARKMALADLAASPAPETQLAAMAVVALALGNRELAGLLVFLDADQLSELVEQFLAWRTVYGEAAS